MVVLVVAVVAVAGSSDHFSLPDSSYPHDSYDHIYRRDRIDHSFHIDLSSAHIDRFAHSDRFGHSDIEKRRKKKKMLNSCWMFVDNSVLPVAVIRIYPRWQSWRRWGHVCHDRQQAVRAAGIHHPRWRPWRNYHLGQHSP